MDNQQRSFLILNNTEKKNNERRKDGIKNITESETIDLINKKHFNEYVFEEFLGEFESYSKTKFKVTHIPCKRSLTFSTSNFLRNDRTCKYCNGKSIDDQKFKSLVKNADSDYLVLSSYKGSNKYITFKHTKCNYIFEMKAGDFLYNGYRCPNCANRVPHTFETLYKKLKEIDKNFTLLKNSNNIYSVREKIKVKCEKCSNIMTSQCRNFITNGRKCEICNPTKMHYNRSKSSKGERCIENFLIENKLNFVKEKTFQDLKSPISNKPLRFDFFLEDFNLIIEYDGKFHSGFSNSSKIFTKESLEKTIWFDRIKNEYCETNKINLLRIDYREDILEVLRRTFNDYRKQ